MGAFEIWKSSGVDMLLPLTDKSKFEKVQFLMERFILSDEDVNTLKRLFDKEAEKGLRTDETVIPTSISNMSMSVTYFTELFDGTEEGEFVVIFLTSKHLILSLALVKPGFPVKVTRKYFIVEGSLYKSPYIMLFEYICDCLLIFFEENELLSKLQITGFCTDLPIIRFGINEAFISYFTPEASSFPLNTYDIRKCFEIVLAKQQFKDLKFTLLAVMNPNTSLLIYSAYTYGSVDIFVNMEDDCDIIYKEQTERVKKCNMKDLAAEYVFIDTELRNFGRDESLKFMATSIDWSLIVETIDIKDPKKECRMRKFLTEPYILESIRLILVALHHSSNYYRGKFVSTLHEANGISLSDIATFINTEIFEKASRIMQESDEASSEETMITKYVIETVIVRSALLLSICLSKIMERFQKDDLIIAIKSSMIEKYPKFEEYVRNFIDRLGPQKKFQFFLVRDNSVTEGASLATSIIARLKKVGMKM